MSKLRDKFLERIFIETGGRQENPIIATLCADIVEKDKSHYVLVRWPESQLLMDEDWFDSECHLADMNRDMTVGNSAYFIPYSRIKFLEDELNKVEKYIKDKNEN